MHSQTSVRDEQYIDEEYDGDLEKGDTPTTIRLTKTYNSSFDTMARTSGQQYEGDHHKG